jgi:hypothetical protein
MEKNTKSWISPKLRKWLRIIHRDLGFLMVGLCLVYGVSGVLLNHINGKDPAYKTETRTITFANGLFKDDIINRWNREKNLPELKKVLEKDETRFTLMLDGGLGEYNLQTGEVNYTHYTKRQFIYWINKLHYNRVKGWYVMADIFAVALIFFAVSGIFMISGKKGIGGSGKWWLIAGLLIPVIYLLAS